MLGASKELPTSEIGIEDESSVYNDFIGDTEAFQIVAFSVSRLLLDNLRRSAGAILSMTQFPHQEL